MDFDTLFEEHFPALVRYCHRLTGDGDVAEDAAQEAMVRFFHGEVSGTPEGIRGWLFRTATNVVRDRYRVEGNRRRLLEANPVRPSPSDGPDERLEREERREDVRRALDRLGDRDQEILLMRYEGFSYREIAEAIGVAATSVGTLLARAEARFATSYRGREADA
ncbi:MAG: sigma-70 family RNA polymerase sigma factor [Gemmatimonadota bacterium]|nr:sigma-70 family RNA polymerase sigma factor [Gemmatimonadota bacterium]MDH5759921.1 sigma-70 family RNA polymerase sigma factor [Gemmatimonadota bacterium]